ncbi:hypothetical protein ACHAQA_003863 [Verticillium albo-atrum]
MSPNEGNDDKFPNSAFSALHESLKGLREALNDGLPDSTAVEDAWATVCFDMKNIAEHPLNRPPPAAGHQFTAEQSNHIKRLHTELKNFRDNGGNWKAVTDVMNTTCLKLDPNYEPIKTELDGTLAQLINAHRRMAGEQGHVQKEAGPPTNELGANNDEEQVTPSDDNEDLGDNHFWAELVGLGFGDVNCEDEDSV